MQTVNKISLIIVFVFISFGAISQDVAPRIFLKNTYVEDIPTINSFEDYYGYWQMCKDFEVPENRFANAPATKNKNHECLTGQGYVYFYVDSTGKIDRRNIGFGGILNQNLKDLIRELLIYSDGLWTPRTVNGKAYQSKEFILPLHFSDGVCKEDNIKQSEGFELLFNYLSSKVVISHEGFYEFPNHYLLKPIKFNRQI
jgi:hypothetical protein